MVLHHCKEDAATMPPGGVPAPGVLCVERLRAST
jgi:hypothetical protein